MLNLKEIWHQWGWLLLMGFIIAGILFPALGTIALLCMLAPVVTSFWSGRNWCGYYCPRGSFNDYLLAKITLKREMPRIFKESWFRLTFLALLMGAFVIQIILAWGSLVAVGAVFVRMVLLTTLLGIILGIIYNYRTWCLICPMGTMAGFIAGFENTRVRLTNVTFLKDRCVDCKLCSRCCPMGIDVAAYRELGRVDHGDCLKCRVCVGKCPKGALFIE